MNIIIANFGDDSVALIQWAYEQKLNNLHILSVVTGWEAESWHDRIKKASEWIKSLNLKHEHLKPQATFPENVRARQRFPNKKFHWCPSFVKGLAILDWLEQHDEDYEATILLPNRKDMVTNSILNEFIEEHEHYDDRQVWHPLYATSNSERDVLIQRTPFKILNHRSLECEPCIYNTAQDFKRMTQTDCKRVTTLEKEINQPMFHPDDYNGARNVAEIKSQLENIQPSHTKDTEHYKAFVASCSWSYGCGM